LCRGRRPALQGKIARRFPLRVDAADRRRSIGQRLRLGLRNDDKTLDAMNKSIMESFQAGGAAFISSTTLRNRLALRACILHYETTEGDLIALPATVHEVGAQFRNA